MLERYKYDVALSFAGEQRQYVHDVWKYLQADSNLNVFYDNSPHVQAKHLGERFSELAQEVYGRTSTFVVIFSSIDYVRKTSTYLEAAYILDRMRLALFREGNIFIAKFDDEAIPGFPNDILYTDLRKNTPQQFAETLRRAIRLRSRIDQDQIQLMLGRNYFLDAIEALDKCLRQTLIYEDEVFAYYSLACAKARLSEQTPTKREVLLSGAAEDFSKCISLIEANRPNLLTEFLKFSNRDDDLLPLRIGRKRAMQLILRKTKVNTKRTGKNYFHTEGCVDPDTSIMTPDGLTAIKDLDVGSEVVCLSPDQPYETRRTVVIRRHIHPYSGVTRLMPNL